MVTKLPDPVRSFRLADTSPCFGVCPVNKFNKFIYLFLIFVFATFGCC